MTRRIPERRLISPKRVLVLQPWGIGDMIMLTPMLSSIRTVFLPAHVTVVAGSTAAAEAVDVRLYDDIRVLPQGWRRPVGAIRAFAALRSGHYEVAITATRLSPWFAAFLRWVSGVPIVAGDCPCDRWSAHTHRVAVEPKEHRVVSNNRILRLLAPRAEPGALGVAADARSAGEAAGIWREAGLEGARVLAVHPGSDPTEGLDKRPNPGIMREVIQGFVDGGPDREAAVFFGPMDGALLDDYADLGPRVKLFQDLPLNTVFALLARCAVMVGGDASLGHAAAARGVPTLTLAGPTLVSSTRPWSPRNVVIRTQEALECMPCYGTALYGHCPYDTRCMRGIGSKAMLSEIDLLLAKAGPS